MPCWNPEIASVIRNLGRRIEEVLAEKDLRITEDQAPRDLPAPRALLEGRVRVVYPQVVLTDRNPPVLALKGIPKGRLALVGWTNLQPVTGIGKRELPLGDADLLYPGLGVPGDCRQTFTLISRLRIIATFLGNLPHKPEPWNTLENLANLAFPEPPGTEEEARENLERILLIHRIANL